MIGVLRSSDLNLKDLWKDDTLSHKYLQAIMHLKRIYLLFRAHRFDDISTSTDKKINDNLGTIQIIVDGFVRCQNLYIFEENCTIDKTFKGYRYRFRENILIKPNKYGTKN